MSVKDLYSVLIELECGEAGFVELVYDDFSIRKAMGPILMKLLAYNNIKVLSQSTKEWKLDVHGTTKYLSFNLKHPKISKSRVNYVATIYV